jgi:cell division cycle 20-like protein 1 (cofactor of APC complex)
VGTPATGNIFRFKTEVRRSAKRALFSGEEEEDALFPGIFTTRGAGPRKVPRSPYKVRRGIGFGAFLIGPSLS